MHRPIRERLEEFLTRDEDQPLPAEFQLHLENCDECLDAVQQMKRQAELLTVLRAPASVTPDPGFYARVMGRIEKQSPPSFWSVFLQPAFGKRLVYASLTLLVLLSTYLVTTEPAATQYGFRAPEALLATQEDPAPALSADQERDRNAILVDLATYSTSRVE
jgi:predicted anti-sigma-YlaC factor YlaD